jgi:large subunit ribosomal protein L14
METIIKERELGIR